MTTPDWNESARIYAEAARKIDFYRESNQAIASRVQPVRGMAICDIGCGSSGLLLELLEAQIRDGQIERFVCVDQSDAMLEVLLERYASLGIETVRSSAETASSSLLAGGFDTVVSNFAFWMFQQDEALAQVAKLVRPGGRLLFTTTEWAVRHTSSAGSNRYGLVSEALSSLGLPAKPLKRTPKPTIGDVCSSLEAHGWRDVSAEAFSTSVPWNQWREFYGIPTIAGKSLPQLPLTQSTQILQRAMDAGADLPPDALHWWLVQATADSPATARTM